MSANSSDTESSCGWTIISNEGSDIETLGPENGGADSIPDPTEVPMILEDDQLSHALEQGAECSGESTLEATQTEENLEEQPDIAEEKVLDEQVVFGSSSDHSDIVTLEPLLVEELGVWEERESALQEPESNEDLGSSSSSQYTFSAPEPLLPSESKAFDSSSDEASEHSSPAVRKRRLRKATASTSEAEEVPAVERPGEPEQQAPRRRGQGSSTLNKCVLLALVIAISMGLGHFYGRFEGTVQIQERHKIVEKIREHEWNDVKGDLYQCQKEQDAIAESKEIVKQLSEDLDEKRDLVLSLTGIMDKITKENQKLRMKQAELQSQKEYLAEELKQTMEERSSIDSQQKTLFLENQNLKNSLEREEESLSSLQEELRNLRAQMRSLEEKGAGTESIITENQKLKDHLEEETQRIRSFLIQKETLMAEAQMLRRELDKERRVTDKLKEHLDQLSQTSENTGETDPETEELQTRLAELEKKLSFEQQRSDLWERLYVETKEEKGKEETPKSKKSKDGVFASVKEKFDAVKNSTKEFVHHHKEQIKKAKAAVKENLKKFSDSVKSTFRHFKDSATRMFNKNRDRKMHERRYQERKDAKSAQHDQQQRTGDPRDHDADKIKTSWQFKQQRPIHTHPRTSTTDNYQENDEEQQYSQYRSPKGCSSVFDCANQESMSLFNKALNPIKAEEFNQLMQSYLKQEVDHFHHWRELQNFMNRFFHNGVFIHDQMLFTDFVSGVEDYLEDMEEYQEGNDEVFDDLDEYVYKHFFGETYSKQYGPSKPFEGPCFINAEYRPPKHDQRPPSRLQKERKWNKPGRTTGRHVANVKIELGPLPFDPKY
ncbi:cell cycle progression protein 1 isoform X1 [Acipenser oxyrinchus oxyrinchus]|uniref:Cell cycle progression protein 1 isoform X1 n=1 Tax=Acipenser oxyrinchus oxyrinchus TaxID=40147 RepID=A0AAD8CWA5_ACIOX|nr:cell cycle progression protein 1 isoform X1 [Acipenser oxyrinchus oxyrinchus]